jgi:hypothetical protein
MNEGPLGYTLHHGFGLFELLLALSSWIAGNPEITLIVWQVASAITLIILYSVFVLRVTKSFFVASVAGIVTIVTPNLIRLYILPRQIFSFLLLVFVFYNIAFISDKFSVKNKKSVFLIFTCASIAWTHPFTFLFLLFSMFVYVLLISENGTRQRILKFLAASSIVGVLPLLPNMLNIFFNVFYEAPSHWTKILVTSNFYLSTLVNWGGGTDLTAALALFSLIVLLFRSRSTKDRMVTILAAWSVTSLTLFHLSFLTSSFLSNWSAYADRSLLIFPSSLLIAVGIGTISQNLVRWFQAWVS